MYDTVRNFWFQVRREHASSSGKSCVCQPWHLIRRSWCNLFMPILFSPDRETKMTLRNVCPLCWIYKGSQILPVWCQPALLLIQYTQHRMLDWNPFSWMKHPFLSMSPFKCAWFSLCLPYCGFVSHMKKMFMISKHDSSLFLPKCRAQKKEKKNVTCNYCVRQ